MNKEKKGQTMVNITKKRTTLIDKNGNIVEQTSGDYKDDLQRRREARAKKLGLKV